MKNKRLKIFLPIVALLLAGTVFFSVIYIPGIPKNKSKFSLSNKNANEKTRKIYQYICESYGNKIISGQQESTWIDTPDYEMNFIKKTTDKLPAIRGLDFMNDDFDGVVERSIAWSKKGGLVSICWHCSKNFDLEYNACKDDVIENWDAVLTLGTPENKAFIENMDKAGKALQTLQDNGVTVLWRPFHEFDGAWFWWGKGGNENFKKLWIMMYNHFTDDLGLNNLIWVLGYSHNGEKVKSWYPGDGYCDIVGADSYEVEENGAEKRLYNPIAKITRNKKPLVMHECGLIPNIEDLQKVKWGWFLTWHSEFLTNENSKEHLKEIYQSDYVITLDELPEF